jgi:hypothetical protein
MRFPGIVLLLAASLSAAPPALRKAAEWPAPSLLRGGAPDPANPSAFFTWGDAVHRWEQGRPRQLSSAPHGFHPGGCALDFDGDGHTDLLLAARPAEGELGDLVLLRGPAYTSTVLDTYVELHDCLPATLHSRRGALIVHRHAQVRFYTPGGVREVYSIYTASRQAGLALADVDADGLPDIYTGNYWVRSPAEPQLPWHIFAIHLHNESDEAASFVYAAWPGLLIGAQRHRTQTPVRLFTRPADPRQLWPESVLPGVLLDHPRAATIHGATAVLGHAAGILMVDPATRRHTATPWQPVLALWSAAGRLYSLSAGAVAVWRR